MKCLGLGMLSHALDRVANELTEQRDGLSMGFGIRDWAMGYGLRSMGYGLLSLALVLFPSWPRLLGFKVLARLARDEWIGWLSAVADLLVDMLRFADRALGHRARVHSINVFLIWGLDSMVDSTKTLKFSIDGLICFD